MMGSTEQLRNARANIKAADEADNVDHKIEYLTSAVECLMEAVNRMQSALQNSARELIND